MVKRKEKYGEERQRQEGPTWAKDTVTVRKLLRKSRHFIRKRKLELDKPP